MFKLPDMDTIIAHSYKDLHVKGFDYVCLKRTDKHTIKFYFMDGDLSKAPEVVAPHDHRYDFRTTVLTGAVENRWYRPAWSGQGEVFQQFQYMTPLNGGSGFEWEREARLAVESVGQYMPGASYNMNFREIHTIQILRPGTILRLDQYVDEVNLKTATRCWFKDKEPASLSGLYNKFTPDEVRERLARVGLEVRT